MFCSRMFLLWGSNIWQIRWRRSELYILYLWFYICFCWKWMTNNKTFHFIITMFFAHLYSADPSLWGILTWPSARWASAGAPPLLEIRTQSGGGSAETDNTWGIKNDLKSQKFQSFTHIQSPLMFMNIFHHQNPLLSIYIYEIRKTKVKNYHLHARLDIVALCTG